MPKRGMVAWLITWEGTKRSEPLAAILHSRTKEREIPTIMELLYALPQRVDDLVAYARKPAGRPYVATEEANGFTCGHNPWLYARLVDGLKVETDAETGVQVVTWMERPIREIVGRGAGGRPRVRVSTPARPQRIERRAALPLWRVGAKA